MDIGTIEDDDVLSVQEESSSSEDERPVSRYRRFGACSVPRCSLVCGSSVLQSCAFQAKKKKIAKKKKSSSEDFSSGFDFSIDDPYATASWDFGKAIEAAAAKGRVCGLGYVHALAATGIYFSPLRVCSVCLPDNYDP